jgi:hypothetical protein
MKDCKFCGYNCGANPACAACIGYKRSYKVKENPKLIQAKKLGKIPYDKLPFRVLEGDAKVQAGGADKYGERNWRIDSILTSTYEGAIMRHFLAWANGEDEDPESGLSHLYHIRACCAVMLDAEMYGKLVDDRLRAVSLDKESDDDTPDKT